MKIATAQKADINKQLLGIPGRIDEAQRAIPEETIDVAAIDAQLSALQTKQDGLMEQKAALLAGDTATAEARKRVAAAEAALAEARTAHLNRAAEANQGTQASITELQGRISTAMSGKYHLRAEIDRQTDVFIVTSRAQHNDECQWTEFDTTDSSTTGPNNTYEIIWDMGGCEWDNPQPGDWTVDVWTSYPN